MSFSIVPPPSPGPSAAAPAPAQPNPTPVPLGQAPTTPAPKAETKGRPLFDHPDIPKRREPVADPNVPPPAPDAELETEAPPLEGEEDGKPPLEDGDVDLDVDDTYFELDGKEVTLAELIETHRKYHTARGREAGANKVFKEAAEMRTNAIETVKRMTTPSGFVDACKQMKVDPYDIAAQIVIERAEYEKMTPEMRRMHDAEQELRAYKAQEERARQQQHAEQMAAQERAYTATVLTHMGNAMDELRVPVDPELRNELVGVAARFMSEDMELGYQTTPQAAMQAAWDRYRERIGKIAPSLPLQQRVGPDERQAIAREEASKRVPVARQTPAKPLPPRADDGKFTRKDVFDWTNPTFSARRK